MSTSQQPSMAETILYGIAQQLLLNLGSKALQEIASAWGFKTQLQELKDTTTAITSVLLAAEEQQSGNRAVGEWLRRLQDVVYAADDLFDEFATVASRKKEELMTGNRTCKEVRTFFSRSNQIAFAFRMARQVKKIRAKLDRIRKDSVESTQFALTVRSGKEIVVRREREETHSFVHAEGVIGREADKNAILGLLLSSTAVEENVSVISIVGIGGQGKTTLAQLVYNDDKVEKHFDLKLWACVSDVFDIKEIMGKILTSANLGVDQLQQRLREKISGKKYLLVLDDVWNESRSKWIELRDLLMVGKTGSKVLVTTRSLDVAKAMSGEQNIPPYQLRGLSEENSWSLFAKMAFKPGQQQTNPELVELGREIVKKCANVPLAIRTIGCLLYGEQQSKWLSLKEKELANITANENEKNIMDVLKVSYHHLPSQLKHCFAYCALFAKDSQIWKGDLIRRWMAEGYVVSSSENESPEQVGDEYFVFLLNRGFFQDVITDEWGNILCCKMHDLMHDLAQDVSRGHIVVAKSTTGNLNERIRHLAIADKDLTSSSEIFESLFKVESLRTLLFSPWSDVNMSTLDPLFSSIRCLRVLDLSGLTGTESLPSSIGKLIHLRYLSLPGSSIKALPDSITELQNLQTLDLSGCRRLEILPKDIWKLINLRHLHLRGNHSLTRVPVGITMLNNLRSLDLLGCTSFLHMPSGMGNLTAIQTLNMFIAGTKNSSASNMRAAATAAQLRDLNTLNNLRGSLEICIRGNLEDPVSDQAKDANLRSKRGLSELKLGWETTEEHGHEGILEGLQPPRDLKKLSIWSYKGESLPSWMNMDQLTCFLPHLVEVTLNYCKRCQHLPLFGRLPFLKILSLVGCESVEYMESDTSISSYALFFPSLERLELRNMERLKGWWKVASEGHNYTRDPGKLTSTSTSSSMGGAAATALEATEQLEQYHHLATSSSSWQPPSFTKLAVLWVYGCPNMTCMPSIPCVEVLTLTNTNTNLTRTAFAFGSGGTNSASKLKTLEIDSAEHLISIPKHCLQNLSSLEISRTLVDYSAIIDWSSIGQVFTSGALSSLHELGVYDGRGLQSLSGMALEHLTTLDTLKLNGCSELELSNSSDDNGIMPWKALQNLRTLSLSEIPKMMALPDGLQYITTLRDLSIRNCDGLKGLPAEWISSLVSLESLELWVCRGLEPLPEGIRFLSRLKSLKIWSCSKTLKERCSNPDGEDWHLIRHIPFTSII